MLTVNVTALRRSLPEYLSRVRAGEELTVTSRGRIVARIVPELEAVRVHKSLQDLRGSCLMIGDIVSPTGEKWEVDQ